MTNIPPISPKNRKGEPPKKQHTRGNLTKPSSNEMINFNFRIPCDLKRDFKIAAASQGISQSEILIQAFQLWKEKNG